MYQWLSTACLRL